MYIDIKVGVAVAFTPLPLQGASLSPLVFTVWVEIFECGRVADGSGSVMPASSLNAFVLRHGTERVLSVTIELEQEVVVLPEGFTMGDCDERDAILLHVGIEMTLDVDRDGAGAFVKDSVEGFVVDKTRHRDPLLLTSRKNVSPVVVRVETVFFTGNDMRKSHVVHDSL